MEPLVLVIDDDERVRELITDILTAFQFRVALAESSEAGLTAAREEHPDLILCDVILPDAVGFDTVRALKDDPATRNTPVVLMTGFPYMQQYDKKGSTQVLLKPFSMASIVETVREALSKASAAQATAAS
jgi:CheY-like chemotaxis protein